MRLEIGTVTVTQALKTAKGVEHFYVNVDGVALGRVRHFPRAMLEAAGNMNVSQRWATPLGFHGTRKAAVAAMVEAYARCGF